MSLFHPDQSPSLEPRHQLTLKTATQDNTIAAKARRKADTMNVTCHKRKYQFGSTNTTPNTTAHREAITPQPTTFFTRRGGTFSVLLHSPYTLSSSNKWTSHYPFLAPSGTRLGLIVTITESLGTCTIVGVSRSSCHSSGVSPGCLPHSSAGKELRRKSERIS